MLDAWPFRSTRTRSQTQINTSTAQQGTGPLLRARPIVLDSRRHRHRTCRDIAPTKGTTACPRPPPPRVLNCGWAARERVYIRRVVDDTVDDGREEVDPGGSEGRGGPDGGGAFLGGGDERGSEPLGSQSAVGHTGRPHFNRRREAWRGTTSLRPILLRSRRDCGSVAASC